MTKKLLLCWLLTAGFTALHAADVSENWAKNCASCHGKDGAGKTKAGKLVGVQDLTDAAVQKAFTDEKAIADIKGGLKDKSGKDLMKPFGEKLSDDEIKALVAYVRTLQK